MAMYEDSGFDFSEFFVKLLLSWQCLVMNFSRGTKPLISVTYVVAACFQINCVGKVHILFWGLMRNYLMFMNSDSFLECPMFFNAMILIPVLRFY